MRRYTQLLAFIILTIALSVGNAVIAQDFTLFEQVDSVDTPQPGQQRPSRENRVTTARPDFTLVGTSRIGDDYSVILNHRDGSKVVVKAKPGENTLITDFTDYAIVDITSGQVSIRLPPTSPCMDFPESGVECSSAANIAELSLANGAPVTPQRPVQVQELAGQAQQIELVDAADEDPANPFAAMRARAQAAGVDASTSQPAPDPDRGGRFTPRRIDPTEVPPGMRIVSTPFGDRLVQQ